MQIIMDTMQTPVVSPTTINIEPGRSGRVMLTKTAAIAGGGVLFSLGAMAGIYLPTQINRGLVRFGLRKAPTPGNILNGTITRIREVAPMGGTTGQQPTIVTEELTLRNVPVTDQVMHEVIEEAASRNNPVVPNKIKV